MKLSLPIAWLCVACMLVGCRSAPSPASDFDKPQITPGVTVLDRTVHSRVLGRDMSVRIITPAMRATTSPLPVVYLLHGAGVSSHDWTNNSKIASFAEKGVVLVLPSMQGSYYINQLNGTHERYEDYFMDELLPAIQTAVPYAATDRAHTAIVGISRGGYGAAVLGLKHPQTFGFIGLISPALDFAERGFRVTAPLDSIQFRRVFGPMGSPTRKENDPYLLIQNFQSSSAPYIFVAVGHRDVLASVTWQFIEVLKSRNLPFEWHPSAGRHDWEAWNDAIPALELSLERRLGISEIAPSVHT